MEPSSIVSDSNQVPMDVAGPTTVYDFSVFCWDKSEKDVPIVLHGPPMIDEIDDGQATDVGLNITAVDSLAVTRDIVDFPLDPAILQSDDLYYRQLFKFVIGPTILASP